MPHLKFQLSRSAASIFVGIAALFFVSSGFAVEAGGAPAIDPEKVRVAKKLIGALNSDSYPIREKAREGLLRLGRSAIEPLEDAVKSDSSETRLRAVELLIALRGRGFLGIMMMAKPVTSDADPADENEPQQAVGVSGVQAGFPAAEAGLTAGDTFLTLNGQPIQDNNDLQRVVFTAGPARVLDAVIDRSGEKLHVPIMLALNMTAVLVPRQGYIPVPAPMIKLEDELPQNETSKERETARQQSAIQLANMYGMAAGTAPANALPAASAKDVETDFEKFKTATEKLDADADKNSK